MKIIELLRFALASVSTELEKDNPNIEDIWKIVEEALVLTKNYASLGKDLTNQETGLLGWRIFIDKYKGT
jgi:hypothetical protein